MKLIIATLMLALPVTSFAKTDTSNQENVDLIKTYLFDDTATKGKLEQNGKTEDGKDCNLKISLSRYGVELQLTTDSKYLVFRASVSSKTSTQFEVTESYDGHVEAEQVARTIDERGSYSNRATLNLDVINDQGSNDNVAGITISNKFKNEPKITEHCSFD